METGKRPAAQLPHAYPFRFVDTVLEASKAPSSAGESDWRGTALSRISVNGRAATGGAWGSPLLFAEAIAQAALAIEGGDAELSRRGFLAGIEGFEASRTP